MKYGSIKTQKIYWTTAEVAELTDIPEHTLRYFEKTLHFLKVPRNRAGRRAWRRQDIDFIKALKTLLEKEDLSVIEAGEKAKNFNKAKKTDAVNIEKVDEIKKKPNVEVLMNLRSELLVAIQELKLKNLNKK